MVKYRIINSRWEGVISVYDGYAVQRKGWFFWWTIKATLGNITSDWWLTLEQAEAVAREYAKFEALKKMGPVKEFELDEDATILESPNANIRT